MPSRLESYRNTKHYATLKNIHSALQGYRNYREFVRAKKLPRVDFFVPNRNLIIEFDESQHFTHPRRITLEHYRDDFKCGFSVSRWSRLCSKLDMKDNDPQFRDEQRAWYDTLRDHAPAILGKGLTIRLYSRDEVWCELDYKKKADINRFKKALLGRKESA